MTPETINADLSSVFQRKKEPAISSSFGLINCRLAIELQVSFQLTSKADLINGVKEKLRQKMFLLWPI
ncbi:MAG TPA: hypothetical protein VLX68_15020 [Chitinivibrionales bacterium]|nr:hypothetical protein [Chitinivibrionales bacterium]